MLDADKRPVQHPATRSAADPGTLFTRATARLQAGETLLAAEDFLACIRLAPDHGAAYVNLAATLHRLALLDQAQALAEQGVALRPHCATARSTLGNVLHDRADYAAAATQYRDALRLAPEHPGLLSSLANTLHILGHPAEALALHDRAVAAAPEQARLRLNRALALLACGDFARGWEEHEWRRNPDGRPARAELGPLWRGEALAGRRILLQAEQGLGDTLQFVRYAPLVAARGGRVLLQVPPCLTRLLRGVAGVEQVLAIGTPLPDIALHCPLMSLPLAFATRLDSIPAAVPYLHPDVGEARAWRARLPQDGLRVGVVWAGSAHVDDIGSHLIDKRRSLAPTELGPLADVPGISWVSLQLQPPPGSDAAGLGLVDPMPAVADFADTAAIVANLDLVIAVDSSVAHLAGGMGVPVWLLSRHDGCWRWLLDRDDSPWYPTMRIYRQARPLDWADVIRRVRHDLIAAVRMRPTGAPA